MTYCIRHSIPKGGKIFKINGLVNNKKYFCQKNGYFWSISYSEYIPLFITTFANEVLSYSINVHCTPLSKYGEQIIGKKVMRILEKHPSSSIVNSLPLIPNRKFAVIIAKSPIFPISHQSPIPTSYSPLFPLSTLHSPLSNLHSPLPTLYSSLPTPHSPFSPLSTHHSPLATPQ